MYSIGRALWQSLFGANEQTYDLAGEAGSFPLRIRPGAAVHPEGSQGSSWPPGGTSFLQLAGLMGHLQVGVATILLDVS